MAKEIEALKQINQVYQLFFYQKQYQETDSENSGIELNAFKKICGILCHPFTANLFAARSSGKMRKRILEYIQKYNIDAVHAEYAAMGQYVSMIKRFKPSIKFNLVLHDVTSQGYLRKKDLSSGLKKLYYSWQYHLVLRNERKWIEQSDTVLTFSNKDTELVKQCYHFQNVHTINTYFGIEKQINIKAKRLPDGYFSIGFYGQMGRPENEQAALRLIKIFDELGDAIPNKHLYIVGAYPSDRLRKFSSSDITITGFLEDPDQFIVEKCDVMVFPLKLGAGIKIKVLASLALGLPVITNQIGAEGIDEHGDFILPAEQNVDFANKILSCYHASDHFSCNKQREFIRNFFSWNYSQNILTRLYEKANE